MNSTKNFPMRQWRCLIVLAVTAITGCSRASSTEDRIRAARETGGLKPQSLFPLAGKATIDGQAPAFDDRKKRLVIMLFDPEKPDLPITSRPHVLAGEHGEFKFSEDGVPPGHYVLTFAVLKRRGSGSFVGPDQLNNLYNDPDVNIKTHPEFVVDHKAPEKRTTNSISRSRARSRTRPRDCTR